LHIRIATARPLGFLPGIIAMDIILFFKGLAVGIVMAVPIGPVAFLCAQRTLAGGRISGLVSGLGAAGADAMCAAVAAFGLTFISDFMVAQQMWFRFFGGVFLCLMGIRAFLSKKVRTGVLTEKLSHFNNFGSTLLLTLSNPMTILLFAAIFAGLGLMGMSNNYDSAVLLIAGVFTGSMFWWILLSISVGMLYKKLGDSTLLLLGRVFGAILTCLGVLVIISAVV